MGTYSQAFEQAVNHAMLYEVGGWWNLNTPGAKEGWTDTPDHRKACGYTNDPNDHGGETKYGIAKNANPDIDVTHLDWEGAKAVYYSHYWLNGKCDKMNGRVAALNFDGGIQHGPGTAAKFIQRAIGVDDDGAIGPGTLSVLNSKEPIPVCNSVCDQRAKYYNNIVANNSSQQKYLAGWLRRVNEMRAFVTDPSKQF
jgi:lysozyme family protein